MFERCMEEKAKVKEVFEQSEILHLPDWYARRIADF